MSVNELLRNSIASNQLLPGVGVTSAESAVISWSLLGCYRWGCANSKLRKNRQVSCQKIAVSVILRCAVFGFSSKTVTSLSLHSTLNLGFIFGEHVTFSDQITTHMHHLVFRIDFQIYFISLTNPVLIHLLIHLSTHPCHHLRSQHPSLLHSFTRG